MKDANTKKIIQYKCNQQDSTYHVYWDGELGATNQAYSPGNDAFIGGITVASLYQTWYKTPVLTDEKGKTLNLEMYIHANMENAYYDEENNQMVFGDGGDIFFPLTSIGIAAHEMSHGFTAKHSGLIYTNESGGLNESFSDMAAEAADYFATQKNNWQIGFEVMKGNNALRYLDDPTLDCMGLPKNTMCSIDNVKDYYPGLEVHYSSGIFNKVFYTLATSNGWNTKKAFDVMVQANRYYWTPSTTFIEAACGVMDAAKELGDDTTAISRAMQTVGLNTKSC